MPDSLYVQEYLDGPEYVVDTGSASVSLLSIVFAFSKQQRQAQSCGPVVYYVCLSQADY